MTRTTSIRLDSAVRTAINKHAVDVGFAPNIRRLAETLNRPLSEIKASLTRLAGGQAVVLHPNSFRIWVAHPFSFAPSAFWVVSAKGSWWANCAWCALGIAAMLDEDARVITRAGGEEVAVEIHIRERTIDESNLLIHFSVPAAKWWDNVLYTCGTILVFRSVREVDSWCQRHAIARGEILSMDQTWALAQAWYGDYLNPRWRRRSAHEAREIFDHIGLTGPFWRTG